MAAMAPLGKLGRVMEMTVHLALVFVVRVLGAENGGTYGTGEMLDMVLAIQGSDVGAAQGAAALVT